MQSRDRQSVHSLIAITLGYHLLIVGCGSLPGQGGSGPSTPTHSSPTPPTTVDASPPFSRSETSDDELTTNADCLRQARKQLTLSTEQRTELRRMGKQELNQVRDILTDEQKQAFQTAVEADQNPRKALRSVNLSTDQKKQVRTILRQQRRQLTSLLTPEQQQQLQASIKECKAQ